jgi:hypothetical protein
LWFGLEFGFLTFAVAFGVTATDNVRVPAFNPFTVDFDIEQIFFDVLTTVSTTLAPRISVTGHHKMEQIEVNRVTHS